MAKRNGRQRIERSRKRREFKVALRLLNELISNWSGPGRDI